MVRTYGYLHTQTYVYKISKHAYHYRLKLQKNAPNGRRHVLVKTNTAQYSISNINAQPASLKPVLNK